MAAAATLRRSEVRVTAGSSSYWLEARRSLDLFGDGHPGDLILRAKGSRSDSLTIDLFLTVGGTPRLLAHWESWWELKDPPFDSTASSATVDSFIRDRLTEVIAGVTASSGLVTQSVFDVGPQVCDGELEHCLRKYWAPHAIDGRDVVAEVLAGPVPIVMFSYGYESTIEMGWIASMGRFMELSACC